MSFGTSTLIKDNNNKAEVTNISPFGIWLLTNGREFFISYKDYPVFEGAPILSVAKVESDQAGNLHWPELDADIEYEALINPEKYSLLFS